MRLIAFRSSVCRVGRAHSLAAMQNADADSSEDEVRSSEAAKSRQRQRNKKAPFSTENVLAAVLGKDATAQEREIKGVRQHLPAYFPPDVAERWKEWSKRTPNHLSDVPEDLRLRECAMPRKCLPAGQQAVVIPRVQTDLITFRNEDSSGATRTELQRDAEARKALVEGDIVVGSTVALKKDATQQFDEPGWSTPFYLGDVLTVTLKPAGADAEGTREIESVLLHYRMPRERSGRSNDITKPWTRVCHGGATHAWTPQCERRTNLCLAAGKDAGQNTAMMTHVTDALEIFETGIEFTDQGRLNMPSKRRLAQEDTEWSALLGLPPPPAKAATSEAKGAPKQQCKRRGTKK